VVGSFLDLKKALRDQSNVKVLQAQAQSQPASRVDHF
jgi:hypothetical protein